MKLPARNQSRGTGKLFKGQEKRISAKGNASGSGRISGYVKGGAFLCF